MEEKKPAFDLDSECPFKAGVRIKGVGGRYINTPSTSLREAVITTYSQLLGVKIPDDILKDRIVPLSVTGKGEDAVYEVEIKTWATRETKDRMMRYGINKGELTIRIEGHGEPIEREVSAESVPLTICMAILTALAQIDNAIMTDDDLSRFELLEENPAKKLIRIARIPRTT